MFEDNYVTKQDYYVFFGDDLDLILPYTDDKTLKSERFIHQTQEWLFNFIRQYSANNEVVVSDENKEKFKIALLWQLNYAISNGIESGISSQAFSYLRNGGFLNIARW